MKQLDYETVENALLTWELALAGGKQVVTAELVGLWFAILCDERVTADEFDKAAVTVLKSARYMPKPVEVLDAVRLIRAEAKALATRKRYEGAVAYTDENGMAVVAIGAAAKALPHGASTGQGHKPDQAVPSRAERIKRMSPVAASWLVGMLKESGHDVSAELQALRAAKAERERKAQEDAERRDEEHAARVRMQAAELRAASE